MKKINNRFERLLILVPYVITNNFTKISDICELLEISKSELLKDLDLLIMCGTSEHFLIDYFIDDEDNLHILLADYLNRPVKLNLNEALAILHSLSIFSKAVGSPSVFKSIEQKIRKTLPQDFRDKLDLQSHLELPAFGGTLASLILEACRNEQSLKITYTSQDGTKTERVIDPLKIVCFYNKWYIIAHCHLRSALRLFLFERIADVKPTTEKFTKPRDFSPDDYMDVFFYPTEKDINVVLQFSKSMSGFVRENWQDSGIDEQPDGSLQVIFFTKTYSWLIGLLLSLGKDVKVLEPVELKNELLETISKII